MTIRYLSAGFAFALVLCACGQKPAANAPASDSSAASSTASTAPAAPATSTPPATSEASGESPKRFDAKSGRIEFTLSGLQSGTETVTWDDWGAKQVTETKTTTSILGMPAIAGNAARPNERRVIVMSDSMTVLDVDAKTGTGIDHLKEQAAALTGNKDMRDMSAAAMAQMGASKTGSDTVAGKTCDVWTMTQMNMTVCAWKGVALKTDGNMMGTKISKVATKIDENVSVDPALFEVPADFTVSAAPTLSQMPPGMAGMMNESAPPAPSGAN